MKDYLCKFVLLLIFFLSSCQYPVFQIDGEDAFRLLYVDENEYSFMEVNDHVYLVMYDDWLNKKEEYGIIEELSKFYNVEGASLFIYTKKHLDELKSKGIKLEQKYIDDSRYMHDLSSDYFYVPYSYRLFYLNGVDTVAKIINPNKRELLYTPKKYVLSDTILLKKALDYLNLSKCFLFHVSSTCDFDKRYDQCYAIFNEFPCSKGEWAFVDDASNDKFFYFEGVKVRMIENEKMYVGYYTEEKLSKEQLARFFKEYYNKKIIYFYNGGRYASIMNNSTLFMFDENRAYDIYLLLN